MARNLSHQAGCKLSRGSNVGVKQISRWDVRLFALSLRGIHSATWKTFFFEGAPIEQLGIFTIAVLVVSSWKAHKRGFSRGKGKLTETRDFQRSRGLFLLNRTLGADSPELPLPRLHGDPPFQSRAGRRAEQKKSLVLYTMGVLLERSQTSFRKDCNGTAMRGESIVGELLARRTQSSSTG